ncbi:MAG: CCA tRNA nucleotidyltransferase [Clostridia bacterium]|nr:CCA tRNA nucleotidyltransferase [Clostridia bacterium]
MRYPEYVAKIIERLESLGFEAYIVGGSVRDMVIGKDPNDFDVTTSALPEQTLAAFSDYRTIPTGLKHGTVTVLSDGNPIEITTFRIDGEYLDSRRPESVEFTDDITADLSRRDFTVNAMAYNHARGFIDPFGGKRDIANRLIRAVGEPHRRFGEDALRIMRAFRFSAQLGFEIDADTLAAAGELTPKLANIARERIGVEFIKLICSARPEYPIELMRELGLFEYVTNGYVPSAETVRALSAPPAVERVRLGIFMSECDSERAGEILHGLRVSNKLLSNTKNIAKNCAARLSGTETDARRFIGSCGELTEDVLAAARALGRLDAEFESYVRENLAKKVCTDSKGLAINGSHLIKLGIKGRDVGEILARLLEHVLEYPEDNDTEKLTALAKNLSEKM